MESVADGIKAEQLGGSRLHLMLQDDISSALDRNCKVGVKQK